MRPEYGAQQRVIGDGGDGHSCPVFDERRNWVGIHCTDQYSCARRNHAHHDFIYIGIQYIKFH